MIFRLLTYNLQSGLCTGVVSSSDYPTIEAFAAVHCKAGDAYMLNPGGCVSAEDFHAAVFSVARIAQPQIKRFAIVDKQGAVIGVTQSRIAVDLPKDLAAVESAEANAGDKIIDGKWIKAPVVAVPVIAGAPADAAAGEL